MENIIEHIVEWQTLALSWQSADPKHRRNHRVALLHRTNEGARLEYLVDSEDFRLAGKCGFVGYPAFNPAKKTVFDTGVLEMFARRLPPHDRTDFMRYLSSFRLPTDQKISVFALLGYSGAHLPSDGFSFVPCIDASLSPFEMLVEVVGYRHSEMKGQNPREMLGRELDISRDRKNKHDPEAVQVICGGRRIGYLNRVLSPMFGELLDMSGIEVFATLERVNGTDERPRPFAFVRVRQRKSGEGSDALALAG